MRKLFTGGNYSREEPIQGRKLYEEIQYVDVSIPLFFAKLYICQNKWCVFKKKRQEYNMRSCDVPQKQKRDDIFTSVPNSGSCLSFTKDISSKHNKNSVLLQFGDFFFQNKRARFIIGSGHWTLHYSNKPVDPACCTLDRLLNKKISQQKTGILSNIQQMIATERLL